MAVDRHHLAVLATRRQISRAVAAAAANTAKKSQFCGCANGGARRSGTERHCQVQITGIVSIKSLITANAARSQRGPQCIPDHTLNLGVVIQLTPNCENVATRYGCRCSAGRYRGPPPSSLPRKISKIISFFEYRCYCRSKLRVPAQPSTNGKTPGGAGGCTLS